MSLRQQNPWSRVGQLLPSGSGSGTRPAGLPVEMVVTSFVNDALRDPNWRQANVDLTIDDPAGFDVFDMYGKVIDHLPKGAVVKVWQVARGPGSGPASGGFAPVKVRVMRNVNWGVPNSLVQNLPEEMLFTVVGYGPPLGVHVSWTPYGIPPGVPPSPPGPPGSPSGPLPELPPPPPGATRANISAEPPNSSRAGVTVRTTPNVPRSGEADNTVGYVEWGMPVNVLSQAPNGWLYVQGLMGFYVSPSGGFPRPGTIITGYVCNTCPENSGGPYVVGGQYY